MDPVSAALHQNLRRFFVATLILTLMTVMFAEPSPGSWPQHRPAPSLSRSARSHPSNSPTTDRLELLPIKVKSILKSEPNPPSYTKNYNGGNCLEHLFTLSLKYFNLWNHSKWVHFVGINNIPDVTSFFLDKDEGTLVWPKNSIFLKWSLSCEVWGVSDSEILFFCWQH